MENFFWSDPLSHTAFPVAKPGYGVIGASAFATAIFAIIGLTALAFFGLVVTFFVCWFFRDPDRVIPSKEGAVVSPADGKVIIRDIVEDCPFMEGPCLKISIFMSIFNVHVNRIPYEGTISRVVYNPGKFFTANLDKASQDNEQNAIVLKTENDKKICFVQIAGLVARRIICGVQEGDSLSRGQRFGMICFGSRLDVYLPSDTKPKVFIGEKVKAGTSVLGYLK
ncbi:MAG: phosphatidylserine decarboxylase family protein [Deltaproteobacteria bacterium]|nr:phosphatidylserine decarboxylase family protein [Deltaproteobacteria bacterium]